jgi:penicillin-binding protein 2
MHDDFMQNGTRERRTRVLLSVVALLFGILTIRLYLLQIADWEQYRIQSENNTMHPVTIQASRGLIRDRNGVIMVDNRPSYTISVVPPRLLANTDSAVRAALIERLAQIVGLPHKKIEEKLESKNRHFYDPIKLKLDVGFEAVSIVEENRYDLPGVEIQVEARRGYPTFNNALPLAPHILGYVGLIDATQYTQIKTQGYRYGDQVGKRGIERLLENRMRGREGVKYIEVNARGREVGSFPEKTQSPVSGEDMWLTIDSRLQQVAERAFGDSLRGSLIAMEPHSGEILVMVSKPGFHLQSIRDPQAWRALQADPSKPLLNRSLQGEYPPASVFKMVTAIAALDMGIIEADEYRFDPCEGEWAFGDRIFGCHKIEGCGELDLREALVQSCDVFFYHLGLEVGITNWNHYSRLFGFGEPTHIDIASGGDGEMHGLVPDRAYYEKRHGRWFNGNMLNLAIGQGEILATPIQVARYTSALATGKLPVPHLLKDAEYQADPLPISSHVLETVQNIMYNVVSLPHGTGRRVRVADVSVAGKTGTAQNPHGKDHAWFVAFAPLESPRIAVAVIVENGGSGGSIAAPIAQKVLSAYFEYLEPQTKTDELVAQHKTAPP